ncbi:MAG: MBL fold metallo-hydrolase [Luteitalea sp.]|nr:MBL fold metallo-hydrolase [Luteitalea sp.]
MDTLASGISYFDLLFQDRPRVIASAVLHSPAGVAIVDPGPSSTLATFRRELAASGIGIGDVTSILLTHIHLDHAGATGTLVRENPRIRVHVHDLGAPHLADPAKLIASAARLYGEAMESLWGEVAPVPREAITLLSGGERIDAGGRRLEVAYTPGHASHHVSYFSADSGVLFAGDVAGIKTKPNAFVLPPTPPPDIDLEQWRSSLATLDAWRPETLFLTHFGPSSPSSPHLTELRDHLDLAARLVEQSLAREEDDATRAAWFAEQVRRALQRMGDTDTRGYEVAASFELSWRGLARYLRKRERGEGGGKISGS